MEKYNVKGILKWFLIFELCGLAFVGISYLFFGLMGDVEFTTSNTTHLGYNWIVHCWLAHPLFLLIGFMSVGNKINQGKLKEISIIT